VRHGRRGLRAVRATCDSRPEGIGIQAMSRVEPAVLVICLLGALASACSLAEPKPKNFTLVDQRPTKADEAGNTLEAAERACKEETRRKGIKSVVNIFSRLRQGAADEDYIACMRRRGYEVSQ
jgi:hypothetical protein